MDAAAGRVNPSSIHQEGVAARAKLEQARRTVAEVLVCQPDEIIFTSGGTESNNLAIFGVNQPRGLVNHRGFSEIEHSSILQTDPKATLIPVNADGLVDLSELKKSLAPKTVLVSIAYANNEIGVIQPIREIAKIIRHARKNGSRVLFHTDACQAPSFLDLNVARLGVDLLTLNSAKVYGPPGVGCLYVKRGIKLTPQLFGGGQERGWRPGTENVEGIVRFAKALKICASKREQESKRLTVLRDYFIKNLLKFPKVNLNGSASARLPNNVNVSFAGIEAEQLVIELDVKGVACSAGSACSARTGDESHVAPNGVRFTLGRDTTKTDLDYVLKILPPIIKKLRSVV